ncbi:MAG: hypothetical protein KGJ28_15355 [Alphaproteobacteria bacterium]|nr:hypothetical protein [Alphaproteobacteria bacterium]
MHKYLILACSVAGLSLGSTAALAEDCFSFNGSSTGDVTFTNNCGRDIIVAVELPSGRVETPLIPQGVTVRHEPSGYLHYYSCFAPQLPYDSETGQYVTYETPFGYTAQTGQRGTVCK